MYLNADAVEGDFTPVLCTEMFMSYLHCLLVFLYKYKVVPYKDTKENSRKVSLQHLLLVQFNWGCL